METADDFIQCLHRRDDKLERRALHNQEVDQLRIVKIPDFGLRYVYEYAARAPNENNYRAFVWEKNYNGRWQNQSYPDRWGRFEQKVKHAVGSKKYDIVIIVSYKNGFGTPTHVTLRDKMLTALANYHSDVLKKLFQSHQLENLAPAKVTTKKAVARRNILVDYINNDNDDSDDSDNSDDEYSDDE